MNLYVKRMSSEDIPFIFHVFEQNRSVLHGNHISLDEWTKYFTDLDTSGGGDPYESHHIIMADTSPAAWLKIQILPQAAEQSITQPTIPSMRLLFPAER